MILCLAILVELTLVTDGRTDGHGSQHVPRQHSVVLTLNIRLIIKSCQYAAIHRTQYI